MGTVNEARQVWFVDDCTTSGSVLQLLHWWHALLTFGPQYRYHYNASKTALYIGETRVCGWCKPCIYSKTLTSRLSLMVHVLLVPLLVPPHLFTPESRTKSSIGLMSYITTLSEITLSQPQSAFSDLTHGIYWVSERTLLGLVLILHCPFFPRICYSYWSTPIINFSASSSWWHEVSVQPTL